LKTIDFGPTYSYIHTLQKKKNTFYYKGTIDLAGSVAGLVSGANIRKGDTIKLFDVPFSQFIKIENDFRHYYKLGPDSQIASRIIAGAGFAYGNSREMPLSNSSLRYSIVYALLEHVLSDREVLTVLQQIPIRFLPDQSGDLKWNSIPNTELKFTD
jgi:hypothetical protein